VGAHRAVFALPSALGSIAKHQRARIAPVLPQCLLAKAVGGTSGNDVAVLCCGHVGGVNVSFGDL